MISIETKFIDYSRAWSDKPFPLDPEAQPLKRKPSRTPETPIPYPSTLNRRSQALISQALNAVDGLVVFFRTAVTVREREREEGVRERGRGGGERERDQVTSAVPSTPSHTLGSVGRGGSRPQTLQGPRHGPSAGSQGGAISYERGTPVMP